MTSQSHESDRYEYRVVDAKDGGGGSAPYSTLDEAKEAAQRRYDMYPEDGPQKIQQRRISAWEDR